MSYAKAIAGYVLIVVGLFSGAGALRDSGILDVGSWFVVDGGDIALPAERVLMVEETEDRGEYSKAQRHVMTGTEKGTVRAFCKASNIPCTLLDKDDDVSLYPEWQPLFDEYKRDPGVLPKILYSKGGKIYKGVIDKDATAQSIIDQIGGK